MYRPTQDKVRAAIFNHLGPSVSGASVLDLYCGTGSLGLEALSRDASRVVFCDRSLSAIRVVKANLAEMQMEPVHYEVVRGEAVTVVSRLSARGEKFDIVFVDPPYEADVYNGILTVLGATSVLRPGAIVVVEHSKRVVLPQVIAGLEFYLEKVYGDTHISYYSKRG